MAYSQAVTDLELLRKMKPDGEYERHIFTTMFDLYALPNDFPDYEAAKALGEPYKRVAALETAFAKAITTSDSFPISSCMNLKHFCFAASSIWRSAILVVKDAANNLEKIWRKQEIPNSSITARKRLQVNVSSKR